MIGNVPEGWRVEKLGDICQFINGYAFKSNEFKSNGIPIVRIGNLLNEKIDLVDKVCYEESSKLEAYTINKADILMAMSGATTGKMAFSDLDEKAYLNQRIGAIRTNENILLSKYLFNFLLGKKSYLLSIAGGSAQPNLSSTDIKKLQIPIPPLPQQEKIVKVLDLSSGLIEKQQELIKKYDLFLKSKFIEMFGDPISNPMGWEVVKLGNLTKVQTGKTPSRKNAEYWTDGTVNWAKTTEVNQTVITEVEEKITDLAVKECNMILFQKETILIAMYGQGKTRGKVVLLGTSTTINQAFGAILPSNNFETLYLLKLLDFMYENIRDLGRGGNQENLNLDIVRGINIILPPITLQNKFAQIVEKIEQIKSQESKKLTQLQTLHASLMEKAFKGEIA